MLDIQANGDQWQATMQPNCSMTWRSLMLVFYAILAVTLIIVSFCIYAGLWWVLPFSGLEMLLLWVGLYLCSLKASVKEELVIRNHDLIIRRGRNGRLYEEEVLTACWVTLELVAEKRDREKQRLLLRTRGVDYEVGRGLIQEERIELASALKKALAIC
ncbi:MAG: DUF2244 domain-containing protein [Gammaproteobacteria bacterium]|nr:DUF2244 domain-containing protein [Gammaproteobacteria bacterium]